jgi:hypothetical protein
MDLGGQLYYPAVLTTGKINLAPTKTVPVPVAARSKAQVYGRSSTAIVGSNPTGGMDVFLLCVVR